MYLPSDIKEGFKKVQYQFNRVLKPNKIVIWEENGMIYVAICKECQEKHADVIEKKRSKGCFQFVRETDEMSGCYLDYMHEEDEE